jgi:hypothetical protein
VGTYGGYKIMPILETHVSGEQLRMPRQVDAGKPFRQVAKVAGYVGAVEEKRRVAKLEFDQKIEAQKTKNQVDTAEINYKSQSKLYDDNFDPNITTFEEHEEGRNELRQQFKDTIESPIGQQEYDLGTEISSTEGHIKSKAKYNKQIIDNANVLRGQKLVSFQANDPRVRVQQARAEIQNGLDSQHIENTEEANEELQATLFKYSTHDATYGNVEEVIKALGDKNDTTYGPLDGEMRKKALAFALETQKQRKRVAEINAGVSSFNASVEVGKISTNPEMTPEQRFYAIEAMPLESADKKKYQQEMMNARVDPRTNATTFRKMNGAVNTLIGRYGKTDIGKEITEKDEAQKFLKSAKRLQDELRREHLNGNLNYEKYVDLTDKLEPVIGLRIDQARGVLKEDMEVPTGYEDDNALNALQTAFDNDMERVDDVFMNYYSATKLLNSRSAGGQARKQFRADIGRDWENTDQDRADLNKSIIVEEKKRDVDSAYSLFTKYSGSDPQPSEADIVFTMNKHNLTREEVLERLNAN